MAKHTLPDGREIEYNHEDPAEVMRVAHLAEPSDDEKRERAKKAFEAEAPQAAAAAKFANAAPMSSVDVDEMIKAAIKAALSAQKDATTPVEEATKPVKGSKSDA